MGRLDGKVALITGAARGQGASEARMFAREGAKVVFGDILDDEGKKVEAEINESGGEATYIYLDVTIEDQWQRAINTAVSKYGKLDVLVNNAGIIIPGGLEEMTEEAWDRTMAVNAKGPFMGTKHSIPVMRAAGGGSIINISSNVGIVGSTRAPASYIASKGAIRLFTKATAIQHAKDNIRCNSIHPGPVDTDMYRVTRPADSIIEQHVPLGRVGRPDEIAYGAVFLASDESSFMTGSELVIDGGTNAQ